MSSATRLPAAVAGPAPSFLHAGAYTSSRSRRLRQVKNIAYSARQARLIRHAVKGIGEKDMIDRRANVLPEIVGVGLNERHVRRPAALVKSDLGGVQQLAINIDRDDVAGDL
jgi:hypothetical protein